MVFPPQYLQVNGAEWQCYTYDTLVILKRNNLTMRAQKLKDLVGASQAPPLLTSSPNEVLAAWIVQLQAAIATAQGIACTPMDYGWSPTPGTFADVSVIEQRRLQAEGGIQVGRFLEPVVQPRSSPLKKSLNDGLVKLSQEEFGFSEAYSRASATSYTDSLDNKHKNRGTAGSFLFRDADHVEVPPAAPYVANPPFQIAPPGYRMGPSGSIHETSYQPPPPNYERRGYCYPQQHEQLE